MKRLVLSMMIAVFFMTEEPALAWKNTYFHTAKMLFIYCTSTETTMAYAFCAFYFSGFINGSLLTQGAAKDGYKSDELCMPGNLSPEEAILVFVRTARALKGERLNSFLDGIPDFSVLVSLEAAFPCQK